MGASAEEQAILDAILGVLPEYSTSNGGGFQPIDSGTINYATSLLDDRLGLAENPLLAILNGTFDYSSLDDVEGEREPAPATPTKSLYESNPTMAAAIKLMDEEGYTPREAIKVARFEVEGIQDDPEDTSERDYLVGEATKVRDELAAYTQWESTPGQMVQSDMSKQMESYGLPGGSYGLGDLNTEYDPAVQQASQSASLLEAAEASHRKANEGIPLPEGVQERARGSAGAAPEGQTHGAGGSVRPEQVMPEGYRSVQPGMMLEAALDYGKVAGEVGSGIVDGGKWAADNSKGIDDSFKAIMDAMQNVGGYSDNQPSGGPQGARGASGGSGMTGALKRGIQSAGSRGPTHAPMTRDLDKFGAYVQAKQNANLSAEEARRQSVYSQHVNQGRTPQRDALMSLLGSLPR